jgi:hypothetical protein
LPFILPLTCIGDYRLIGPHELHSFDVVVVVLFYRTRLVAVAAQKFVSDIASDSLQYVNLLVILLFV